MEAKAKPQKQKQVKRSKVPIRELKAPVERIAETSSYFTQAGVAVSAKEVEARFAAATTLAERTRTLEWLNALQRVTEEFEVVPEPPPVGRFSVPDKSNNWLPAALMAAGIPTVDPPAQNPPLTGSLITGPFIRSEMADKIKQLVDNGKVRGFTPEDGDFFVLKGRPRSDGTETWNIQLTFPYPKFSDKQHYTLPAYRPTYHFIPYDRGLLVYFQTRLARAKFGDKELTKKAIVEYNYLVKIARENVWSAGTPEGRVARFAAMEKQKVEGEKTAKRLKSFLVKGTPVAKHMADRVASIENCISKYFPLVQAILIDDVEIDPVGCLPGLVGVDVLRWMRSAEDKELYPVMRGNSLKYKLNAEATPGPLYAKTTFEVEVDGVEQSFPVRKAQTELADFAINSHILAELQQKPTKEFIAANRWVLTTISFPKTEVYPKAELKTKTRNINGPNECVVKAAGIIALNYTSLKEKSEYASMVYSNPKSNEPHRWLMTKGTQDLSGFSPFNGGMDRYMSKVLRMAKYALPENVSKLKPTLFRAVYADNIFFALPGRKGGVTGCWVISDDLSKAESTVKKQQVIAVHNQSMKVFNGVSENWKRYMELIAHLTLNASGLWNSVQIKNPGLGSGMPFTAAINGTQSLEIVHIAALDFEAQNKKGVPDIYSNPYYRTLDEDQPMRTESYVYGIDMCGAFLKTERTDFVPSNERPVKVDLDLLGYDAILFRIDDETDLYFASLQKDRLAKSMLFRKAGYDESGVSTLPLAVSTFLDLLRIRTEVFNGLYNYPIWYKVRMLQAFKLQETLANLVENVTDIEAYTEEDIIEELFDMEDEHIDLWGSFISLLKGPSVPTIFQLVYLHTGDMDLVARAMKYRLGTLPLTFLGTREEIISVFGADFDVVTEFRREADLTLNNLVKLYPLSMVSLEDRDEKLKTLLPSNSKNRDQSDIEPSKIAMNPTRNPVRPEFTKVKKERSEKAIDRDLSKDDRFTKWLASLYDGGPKYYRVPIPFDKLNSNQMADVRMEKFVAESYVKSGLMDAFQITEDYALALVKDIVSNNVFFIIRPLYNSKPRAGEMDQLAIGEMEVSNRVLEEGRLLDRVYSVPARYLDEKTFGKNMVLNNPLSQLPREKKLKKKREKEPAKKIVQRDDSEDVRMAIEELRAQGGLDKWAGFVASMGLNDWYMKASKKLLEIKKNDPTANIYSLMDDLETAHAQAIETVRDRKKVKGKKTEDEIKRVNDIMGKK